jgi:integrase
VLAFFFLLRVGEYTPSKTPRRTIPLRKKDVRLWRNNQLISHDAPLAELLAADAVTLCLENQKNGNKNAVLHHTSSGDSLFCPVTSAARLIHALRTSGVDAPLGSFVNEQGRMQSVSAADIRAAIRLGAVGDNLEASGYDLRRIGSHSLRSGGAMRLKLAGYDDDIIKKLGRWTSNTYLRYIQTQIGNLTAGIATNMARLLRFHHVGA